MSTPEEDRLRTRVAELEANAVRTRVAIGFIVLTVAGAIVLLGYWWWRWGRLGYPPPWC